MLLVQLASLASMLKKLEENYLIQGKVLRKLVVKPIIKQGFEKYMKSIGKLGGQNKVPRLANDRKIADALQKTK